jgi:hypothetical protein
MINNWVLHEEEMINNWVLHEEEMINNWVLHEEEMSLFYIIILSQNDTYIQERYKFTTPLGVIKDS